MTVKPFSIDSSLREARTPPGGFYDDAGLHQKMLQRAFVPSWQPLLDVQEPARWEQAPATLLPGSLDEPLLWVRDESGDRVLSNVCTHRGALLVQSVRRGKQIACPYHGRCFDLRGEVKGAPGFAGREASLPALREVRSASVGPMRWVSLGEPAALEESLSVLDERAPGLPWEQLRFRSSLRRDYEVGAHWALYVENYLEGLHIPFVHPGLDRVVLRDSYTTEPVQGGVLQTAHGRGGGPQLPGGAAALYLWLFPNVMLNVYPWGVSLNVVQPRSVNQCVVAFRSWVWDESSLDVGAGADLGSVELEDEAVVARVRAGIGARLYGRGHYADPAEAGVHHFHRLLVAALWQ